LLVLPDQVLIIRDVIASNACVETNNRYNKCMEKKKLRKVLFWAGAMLLVVSVAALVYALRPTPMQVEQFLLDGALFSVTGGLP